MKFKEYISKNQVFTSEDLDRAISNPASIKTSLRRAIASGEVERVRRGLYVSKTGLFLEKKADPYLVAAALAPDVVFSFHSALQLLGLAHNISFEVSFCSEKLIQPFEYDGVRYTRYTPKPHQLTQTIHLDQGQLLKVTTREQTLVDCLEYPGRAGGSEEVIKSLSSIPYLDYAAVEDLLLRAPVATAAKAGWLLSIHQKKWRIEDLSLKKIKARLGKGPYRFSLKKNEPCQSWVKEWNLCLPEIKGEVLSWTT